MHGKLTTTAFFWLAIEVAGVIIFAVIDMEIFQPMHPKPKSWKPQPKPRRHKPTKGCGNKLRLITMYYLIFCAFVYAHVNYPHLVDPDYLYKAFTTRKKVRGAKKS